MSIKEIIVGLLYLKWRNNCSSFEDLFEVYLLWTVRFRARFFFISLEKRFYFVGLHSLTLYLSWLKLVVKYIP